LFFKEIKEGKNHFLKETSSFNRSRIASEKMINDATTKGMEKKRTRLSFYYYYYAHHAAPRKSIIDQHQCHRFPHSPLLPGFIIIISSFVFFFYFSGHVQVAIIIITVESGENVRGANLFLNICNQVTCVTKELND
jgi:hypothetical protein